MISTVAQVLADDDVGEVLIHDQRPCTTWVLKFVGGILARRPSEEAVVADLGQSVMVARRKIWQAAAACYNDDHCHAHAKSEAIFWTLCC